MDTIPEREFMGIFDRITKYVDLEGCYTPRDIDERLKAHGKDRRLKTLESSGFGMRAIPEAMKSPRGKVMLTLHYGREWAKKIIRRRHGVSKPSSRT